MSILEYAGVSDQGRVRFQNEDFILHEIPDDPDVLRRKGALFVIADGVGGSDAGEIASREAARMLVHAYYESRRAPAHALSEAVRRANVHVYNLSLRRGRFRMETTLTALALVGDTAHITDVGDTRIYRVRGGRVELLTRDHSEVAELVRMKLLSPEKARHHPRRNVITRSVGNDLVLHPYFARETLAAGDIFVLCTDGLWETVEDAEIAEVAAGHSAQDACRRLIALGLERQTTDNLSVQVVKVLEVDHETTPAPANDVPWWRRLLHRTEHQR